MRARPAHFLLLLCAASWGLTLGVGQRSLRSPSGLRRPSSVPSPQALLGWDQLACPSAEEFRRLGSIVHLDIPEGLVDPCSAPDQAQLAKLLAYSAALKIQAPPDWAPLLMPDLEAPLAFVGKNVTRMGLDPSLTVAASARGTEIALGPLFFRSLPLDSLVTLVREARRANAQAPGAVACRRKDLPGDCDAALSIDPANAGAFSYSSAFYAALGLYADGLGSPDRAYLLSRGLAEISLRFNVLPPELARAFDLVALLDKDGNVFLLHPFLKEPFALHPDFLADGEKIARLELNVRNDGLLLFTTRGRLFTWAADGGFSRLYPDTLTDSFAVTDAARIRAPLTEFPYYTFLAGERDLRLYRFHAEAYELAPYPVFPGGENVPELSRLFMGLNGRSLFLGKEGRLYAGQRVSEEAAFDPRADLQAPKPWSQVTGGVVYESLYGVTADGRVQFTRADSLDEPGFESYAVAESSFQAEGGARKLLEGLTFRALLDTRGVLHFETYDRARRSEWNKFAAQDFAIIRTHVVNASAALDNSFATRCHVRKPLPDPWFGAGLGLDYAGRLVVGLPDGTCTVAGTTLYSELSHFEKAQHQGSEERGLDPASRSSLKLVTESGEQIEIRPYEYP